MIDISLECGLSVKLDNISFKLILDESLLLEKEPEERKLEELQSVLYQKDVQEPEKLYTLFNNVGSARARNFLLEHGLRYDIGIMPPLKIGTEYIKTIGHYHAKSPGMILPYAEVYEIVSGRAHFLLQKQDEKDDSIVTDIVWLEAKKGDRLIMPPDYAHVTINPGPEALVLSNLAAVSGAQSYSRIVKMGGFAYFNIEEGGNSTFVRNPKYIDVPPIRKVPFKDLGETGIDSTQPIYTTVLKEPKKFSFITKPQLLDKILKLKGES